MLIRIFEDFAFYTMMEASEKRATNILEIPERKHAFDSTTIPLCLATFPWAKFRKKKKRKVRSKLMSYMTLKHKFSAFYTVITTSKHDSKAMCSIRYEPNAYYIFDRAYESFKELYRIHLTSSFFVVRAKTDFKNTIVKWKRRMLKDVLTAAEVKLTSDLSEKKKYPELFRLILYYEDDCEFTFLMHALHISALDVAKIYRKDSWSSYSTNCSRNTLKKRDSGVQRKMLSAFNLVWRLSLTVSWLLSNTIN